MDPAFQRVFDANFPGLTVPEEIAALVPRRRLSDGRSLFVQGQRPTAFYAVASGEMETRFTGADGTVSVIENVAAPRLFGLSAFAAGQPAGYEAIARGTSELLVFGREAYQRLMDEVPGFARALLAEFASRYDGTLRLLLAARHQDAGERFRLALSQLARERGRPGEDGWTEVRATQQELARLAHLSRQTVNELMQAARAEGRLRLARGRWWCRPLK